MIYTPSQMYQWFLSLYSDHGFLSKLQTHTSKLLRIIFTWITELFQIQYTQTHYSALSLPFSVSLSFTFTFDNASPWNKGEPCSSSAFCFLILILSISLHSIPVVIHFMCWLGWDIVPRYVDIQILDVSEIVSFGRYWHLNLCSLSQVDCPPYMGGLHLIDWRPEEIRKNDFPSERDNFISR